MWYVFFVKSNPRVDQNDECICDKLLVETTQCFIKCCIG